MIRDWKSDDKKLVVGKKPKTMISLLKKDKNGEYVPVFVDSFKGLNHVAMVRDDRILLEIYLD